MAVITDSARDLRPVKEKKERGGAEEEGTEEEAGKEEVRGGERGKEEWKEEMTQIYKGLNTGAGVGGAGTGNLLQILGQV